MHRKQEKPLKLAAHRAFALFTFRQQIHCIYMHISIQMLCHMDIYNWPDIVRCYMVHKTVKTLLLHLFSISCTVHFFCEYKIAQT